MSSIKVNVRSKVRLTSTGQTTFVKKVVLGTPVRSVTTDTTTNINSIGGVNTTGKQDGELLIFDSAENTFKTFTLEGSNGLARTYTPDSDKIGFKIDSSSSPVIQGLTVSGDILPAADSSSDLGSPTKKFKDLYLSGDTIILGSIRLRDSDGGLGVVDPTTRAPKPLNMRGSIAQIRKFFSAAGDLTYNPNTGVFGIDVETVYTKANFDSDLGAALSGGAGITYDSSSDTISLTNTSVTPGTYGSASQVPQIVVNTKGQITNASNVSIAGVTGVTFDSSNGALTVSTSAGSNFTDSINLNPFSTSNLSEGSNLYFTSGRADARVNAGFSAKSTTNLSEGDNLYYTTARADSAFDARFDSSFDERLGTKSTANLSEGSNLYYTTTRADSAFDARFDSSFDERLATKSTSNLSEGSNLYFTTGRVDARVNLQTGSNLDLSSKSTSNLSEGTNLYFTTARADSDARHALSGSNSITYSTSTGDIRAPQPLDSAANPTFNQLRGPATFVIDPATIGDATGTVRVLGNLTVEGTTTTINSTNVSVNDKTFTIADSAADSSGLNDAGIIWGGSSITANKPSFQYNHASERFDANRTINATSFIGSVTGNVSGTAASVTNAAQTNITSLGTLTGLTSTGDVAIDSAGGFLFDVSEKKLVFGDNYAITLGSSNDFVMKHTPGGNTVIQENNTSGSLLLKAANLQIQNPSGSEVMADFNVNGSVELYHDNIKKLETTKYGTTVTGTINADSATLTNATITNRLDVATSDTLSSGLLSLLQSGSGDASINFELVGTKGYSIGIDNSDADKFKISNNATIGTSDILSINTSGNSTFTGDLAIDSAGGFLFDVSDKALEFGDNYKATFGTGGDLEIYHDGSNSIISDGGTGTLNFRSSYYNINNAANDKSIIRGNEFGVEVLHNNSVKFSTRDSGVTITGELNADSATFTNATISNISNAPIFKAVGANEGGEINLEKAPNSSLDGGTYNRTVIDMNVNKFRIFTNGSARGAHLNLSKMDSNTAGSNEIVTEQTSHTFTKSQTFSDDVLIDSDGGFFFDVSDKKLALGDNYKAIFGNGSDFQIFHNGNNTFLKENGTGSLLVQTSFMAITKTDGSSNMAKFFNDGQVELYHNANKKIETTDAGATVTGTLVADGISVGDNENISVGAGDDLRIFHDGANSRIYGTTGDTNIGQNTFGAIRLTADNDAENMLVANVNGAVELYYDNNKKFETRDSGVTITGELNVDSATVTQNLRSDGGNLIMGDEAYSASANYVGMKTSFQSGSTDYMIISGVSDGSTYVSAKSGSTLYLRAGGNNQDHQLQVHASHARAYGDFIFDSGGAIRFDKSDKALEFGDNYKATFGAGADLAIFHDGGNSAIIDQGTGGLFIRGSSINIDDTSSNDYITATEGGAVTLFHNGSSKLATTSTGVTITGNPYIIGDQMVFEGATPNSHELFIQITDPTDDRTITLPDASGTVLLNSGDQTITGDLTLTATDDTSNSTPELKLVRHSSSPADYDYIGGLSFLADNSTDSNIEYGTIEARIRDVTKDTEDFAGFELFGVKNGTARQRFMILGQEIFHLMNRQTIKFDDITGTDDLTIAPPSSLSASQTITLPDATGTVILNTGGTFTGDVSVTGKITSSDSAIFDGNGSSGGVSISDGLIDIRTGTGLVSKIKFYCESSNAHFQTLQAAPHSEASSAVIVLPTASGTLLNENGSAANLTQIPMAQASGTLAAANVGNLPASKITSGVFDSARLPAGAFASGGGGGGEANQNAFSTISVAGQSDVVADAATDTVTFVAGSNMTITTNASGDTVTFASSGGGGGGGGGLDSADVLTVTGTASITGVSGDLTVAGALSATTKSFDIEHPTENGKRLRYGSLEGPENGVYVRGRIKGINKIKLPDYWTGLVDEETITVNITPIGSEQCLFVEDIQSGEVIIGGGQDIDCFYTVYGERKDVEKLEVEY